MLTRCLYLKPTLPLDQIDENNNNNNNNNNDDDDDAW